jgi:hypothetical protein
MDDFLEADGVRTAEDAIRWSVIAALQRNRVYRTDDELARAEFRSAWANLIHEESQAYGQPVSDRRHCDAIRRISEKLSSRFSASLIGGRLRYGTSQKAFNLYLKYLWRMGKIAPPPHCPVDSVVMDEAGIVASWTTCDSEEQYIKWISGIREKAAPLSLAEWENDVWLRWRVKLRRAHRAKKL